MSDAVSITGPGRSTCRLEVDVPEYRRLLGCIGKVVNVTMAGKRWSKRGFDIGWFERHVDSGVVQHFVTLVERAGELSRLIESEYVADFSEWTERVLLRMGGDRVSVRRFLQAYREGNPEIAEQDVPELRGHSVREARESLYRRNDGLPS